MHTLTKSPALERHQSTVLLPGIYGLVLPGHGLLDHPGSELHFPDVFAVCVFTDIMKPTPGPTPPAVYTMSSWGSYG